jgi:hypothetical protein
MRLIVAWGVRPVLILPVGNDAALAQGIGPVVPRFAACRVVGLSVLLVGALHDGEDEISKLVNGVLPEHRVVNVAGHVGSPVCDTS